MKADDRNICPISVTFETSHELIGWLKAVFNWNIDAIFVTELTIHPPIGWLNAVQESNIFAIVVTWATFHAEMSVLKDLCNKNKLDMSVMAETSQVPMALGVHVPIGEVAMQALTAATRSSLTVNTYDGGDGGGGGGGGDGGDGGGDGGNASHTKPGVDAPNADVSRSVFAIQIAEQSTWSNLIALENILVKSIQLCTSHTPIGWLKLDAVANR